MLTRDVPFTVDRLRSRVLVGDGKTGKAHVLHCSYYNNYLLRTVWKDAAGFVDSERLLIGAAAEQAYFQLKGLFETHAIADCGERKAFASRFYAWQGFGLLDFGPIQADGGVSRSTSQHYAEGWKEQFGLSSEPIGFMTRGWLAGAAAAIFDLPHGHFSTYQLECAAVTDGTDSVFELRPGGPNYDLFEGNGVGPISGAIARMDAPTGNIDAMAVADAVATLPLFGSEDIDGGLIKSFDVLISWHPHQYYDRISMECVRQAIAKFGDEGREAVEPLLEEAGHRCAFRTFGGIWRSAEWEAAVEPMCSTREDWIFGMVAISNCAGWGRIECLRLSEEEAVFEVHDDYESVGCLNLYGSTEFPPIYLLKGGFRGMMNLVYNENIMDKPSLTEDLYNRMCRREDAYQTCVETSIAMGDPVSVFRVTRKAAR
jgi:hypothetical protein